MVINLFKHAIKILSFKIQKYKSTTPAQMVVTSMMIKWNFFFKFTYTFFFFFEENKSFKIILILIKLIFTKI